MDEIRELRTRLQIAEAKNAILTEEIAALRKRVAEGEEILKEWIEAHRQVLGIDFAAYQKEPTSGVVDE